MDTFVMKLISVCWRIISDLYIIVLSRVSTSLYRIKILGKQNIYLQKMPFVILFKPEKDYGVAKVPLGIF